MSSRYSVTRLFCAIIVGWGKGGGFTMVVRKGQGGQKYLCFKASQSGEIYTIERTLFTNVPHY
jgi:hypothetical protein